MKMQDMIEGDNRKGFTVVEVLIIVAIVAMIAVIFLPAILGNSSSSKTHPAYEGWKHVADGPRNHHIYVKYVPEQHATIWWDDYHGTFTVVKD